MKGNIDIIHLHTCVGGPFYRKGILLLTAGLFKVKTVLHHHTDYATFFENARGVKGRFIKHVIRKADMNIVLGDCLKKQLEDFAGECYTVVIRNGVSIPENRQYNNDAFGILFLGWFQEVKGFFDFLSAFKLIENEIEKRYKLILCGGGSANEVSQIKSMGLDNRIHYIGWANDEKKSELFKSVLVNVLPSYNEGLPMSIIETMAYGIPNIGTNVSTIPEIILDKKTGYIVERGDTYTLSQKLKSIINDAVIREEFSEQSFNWINKEFRLNRQIEKTNNLYHRLIGIEGKER